MSSSDIQVFVRWKDQTIFAGEDVECTITFRNVAESNNPDSNDHSGQLTPHQSQRKQPRTGNSDSSSFFSLKSPQNLFFGSGRRSSSISPHKKPSHRFSSSLSTSHSFPPPSTPRVGPPPGHKHKRSVSILSIDSEGAGAGAGAGGTGGGGGGGGDRTPSSSTSSPFSRTRPPRGHGRSASLQVLPRRNESYDEAFAKGVCYPGSRASSVSIVRLPVFYQ